MGPITLTIFQGGASLCLPSFLLWNVYVCNPEILGCACHSLNRICSWAVLEEFSSTHILSVDHPKKSVFVQKLYISTTYFVSSCAIHWFFFVGTGDVCFAEIPMVNPVPRVDSNNSPTRQGFD